MVALLRISTFVLLLLHGSPVEARLGSGIKELTSDNFDSFLKANPRVMVDFVNETGAETEELTKALRVIRNEGSRVPLARVDGSKHRDLVKRFVGATGCDEESKLCGSSLPQLVWFLHGEATQYHRNLRKAESIMNFVLALDREPVPTFESAEQALARWNPVVLAQVERASPLYKTLEVVALRNMDGVAFAHVETPGRNISWIKDSEAVLAFNGSENVADIDAWVHKRLTISEDLPDESENDGSVVVVGNTFEELMLRNDRDVMLLVYAPWCGFSRQALKHWSKFATLLAGVSGAPVVAKMDGSRNRSPLPDFHWTTFPVIVYVQARNQTPQVFSADVERNVDSFMEFAHNHSTVPFNADTEAISMLQTELSLKEL